MTHKYGWGGEVQGGSAGQTSDKNYSYTNNRRSDFYYDAAGNLTNDLGQPFTYDATGQQVNGGYSMVQSYDGDGLRVKKADNGAQTYYLRSSVLGGQVVAEISSTGTWTRGYVYLGPQLLAVQQAGVYWMHEDPVTKSKRVTNSAGAVVSTIELDPWGADTSRSTNSAFQPKKFTSYERDANGSDEAMFRRYNRWHSRFDQPDPYNGSYQLSNPQSFNRYAYVQGDPVNFVDPSGLEAALVCLVDGMPVNCSTAFALVNSGAGRVTSGAGFYGDVLVVNEYSPNRGNDGWRLTGQHVYLGPNNESDCSRFVKRLLSHSGGPDSLLGEAVVGRDLLAVVEANKVANQYPTMGVSGFKNAFIDHQGGWAQAHIMGMAGAIMVGKSSGVPLFGSQTGFNIAQAQLDQDKGELAQATRQNNKDLMAEKTSEVNDDMAGVATGILLKMHVKGTRSYDETQADLFDILCDL